MTYIPASWGDWARKFRKPLKPGSGPLHQTSGAGQSTPVEHAVIPHADTVSDPMMAWGRSLDEFHAWQVSSGLEIMHSGQGPQSAADFQNSLIAQQSPEPLPHNHVSDIAQQAQPARIKEPWRMPDPINNPFSTVPGAPGPLGPPKPPGMV